LRPLLLYLHAISFGHAYIRVMSIAFLALVALGLLQQALARLNRDRLISVWLVVHVTLATLLVFLIGYHAFNAFYYE
jgi:cytochrome b561